MDTLRLGQILCWLALRVRLLHMKIAIVGTGSIGSTFAFQLARSAHDVTVIARGERLEQLQAEKAIVTVSGERAAVRVSAALDPVTDYDLVLVTVLAPQVDSVLPSLQASAAKTVMFMFNTFESLDRLRNAVGERFAFGFPAILASLPGGTLKFRVFARPQSTLVTEEVWAQVFTEAGIFTVVQDDIESWLRTHAAMVAPMMAVSARVHTRRTGISWAEARTHALAVREGLELVRRLGNTVKPAGMAIIGRLPTSLVMAVLWAVSRLKSTQNLAQGPSEPRALIDAMSAAAPEHSWALRAIRP